MTKKQFLQQGLQLIDTCMWPNQEKIAARRYCLAQYLRGWRYSGCQPGPTKGTRCLFYNWCRAALAGDTLLLHIERARLKKKAEEDANGTTHEETRSTGSETS